MQAPLWFRKFIVDAVETAIGLLLAIEIVFPGTLAEAKAAAVVIGTAILGALVSAGRRAVPAFIAWLSSKLGTTES